MSEKTKLPFGLISKIKFTVIGLIVGLIIGILGTIFIQNYNPEDQASTTTSVVFERIVSKDELVSAAQSYNVTDKFGKSAKFFDLFDIPFTDNAVWYRYVGTIKAGVDLSTATYVQNGNTITIELDQPYIISNTPNMDKSGVLEERNNILNPIHVEDVDEFQKYCIEQSEENAIENGNLFEEAKTYAEQDIRDMFYAALGDGYTIEFQWREQS